MSGSRRSGWTLESFSHNPGHMPSFYHGLTAPSRGENVNSDRRLLEKLSTTKLKTAWVPLCLPALPKENRSLYKCIDTDESQDWWVGWRVRKHLAEMHPEHLRRITLLSKGAEISVGTIYRRVREGKSRSEIRTDGLAGCLRTPRGGSSKQIVFIAGKGQIRMRWMTPREYARLQGCPDYPINVERNEALWGFGDAVCVPVISWIAKNVLSQLFPAATHPRQTSRRRATESGSRSLHSQITAVRHPISRRASRTRLSRLRFRSIFRCPVGSIRTWQGRIFASLMCVPEAAVNEEGQVAIS